MPKVGVVKDISTAGLSFEYLFEDPSGPDPDHVDIWMAGASIFVRDVPCKKVYDITSPAEKENRFICTTGMNRCGLKFGALSALQSAQLSSLIEACNAFAAP